MLKEKPAGLVHLRADDTSSFATAVIEVQAADSQIFFTKARVIGYSTQFCDGGNIVSIGHEALQGLSEMTIAHFLKLSAPRVGIEPTTNSLTASRSTAELPRNVFAPRVGIEPTTKTRCSKIFLPTRGKFHSNGNLYFSKPSV